MAKGFLKNKKLIAETVLIGGFFVAAAIFLFFGFNKSGSTAAANAMRWTENTGAGISAPACNSAPPTNAKLTCDQSGVPYATLTWAGDCGYLFDGTPFPYIAFWGGQNLSGNFTCGPSYPTTNTAPLPFFPSGAGGNGGIGIWPVTGGTSADTSILSGKDLGPLINSQFLYYGAGGGASGGGFSCSNSQGQYALGGNGGGYVVIEANKIVLDNGSNITARGQNGQTIDTDRCGKTGGGGGGGGTIIVRYVNLNNNGSIDVSGGQGGQGGGSGASGIILTQLGAGNFGSGSMGDVIISSDITEGGTFEINNLTINEGGILRPSQGAVLHLKIKGTLKIKNGGMINADGRGALGGAGWGGGGYSANGAGGGGGDGSIKTQIDVTGGGGGGGGYDGISGYGMNVGDYKLFNSLGGATNYYYGVYNAYNNEQWIRHPIIIGFFTPVACLPLPPPFDYNLSNSGDVTVVAGSSTSTSIFATRVSGNPQSVAFSISSITPSASGITTSFNPTSCMPSDNCSTNLNISVNKNVSSGTYQVTVNGTSQGIVDKTTTFNLIIKSSLGDFTLSVDNNLTCNSVPLRWTASSGADGYEIFRKAPPQVPNWVDITPYKFIALMFTDTNVSQNTNYVYQIAAYNTVGTTTSNALPVTTPYCPPNLTFWANPSQIYQGQTTSLNWNILNDVTSCNASSDPSQSDWNSSPIAIQLPSGNKTVIPSLPPRVTYYLECFGRGGTSGKKPASVDISPLGLPGWREIIPR